MTGTERELTAVSAGWEPTNRQAMLDYLSAEAKRRIIKASYQDASDVAAALDPHYVVTPALKLIAQAIETVLKQPRHNLLVTCPPQEGKTTLCAVYTPLRALMLNPNTRIILATHGDQLAEDSSRMCQTLIGQHGSGVIDPLTGVAVEDKLGYRIAVGAAKVKSWKLRGARGGMLAVGWGSSIVGRPADLLIIDDVFKNLMEADSHNHRRKITEWFSSVAMTRLSPNASIIHISTRWNPQDLAGSIIEREHLAPDRYKTWKHINIPAIAEEGIPDALNRQPGEVMESARGRTKAEFEQTRRIIGERVWWAMYMGAPAPPEGGLFQRAWFEPPADPPHNPIATIVGIDPADSGEGDDSGIVAAALNSDGIIVFFEDWSGKFTAEQWAHRAVLLALTTSAREVGLEAYAAATTYKDVLTRAYRAIHLDAVLKQRAGAELTSVEFRALSEQPPFMIHKWRAGGRRIDAVGRSALLRQAFETRHARVVEHKMAQLVEDACGWQTDQHQPDRVAAAIIAHDRLAALGGGRMTVATPINERPDPVTRLRSVNAPPNRLARRLGS